MLELVFAAGSLGDTGKGVATEAEDGSASCTTGLGDWMVAGDAGTSSVAAGAGAEGLLTATAVANSLVRAGVPAPQPMEATTTHGMICVNVAPAILCPPNGLKFNCEAAPA